MDGIGLTLVELRAQLLGVPYYNERGNVVYPHVDNLNDAHGIRYLCPKCFEENSGSVGTHGIVNFDPSISQEFRPTPGRWNLIGTGLDDLSLINESSSIAMTGEGCKAHFFVSFGKISNQKAEGLD